MYVSKAGASDAIRDVHDSGHAEGGRNHCERVGTSPQQQRRQTDRQHHRQPRQRQVIMHDTLQHRDDGHDRQQRPVPPQPSRWRRGSEGSFSRDRIGLLTPSAQRWSAARGPAESLTRPPAEGTTGSEPHGRCLTTTSAVTVESGPAHPVQTSTGGHHVQRTRTPRPLRRLRRSPRPRGPVRGTGTGLAPWPPSCSRRRARPRWARCGRRPHPRDPETSLFDSPAVRSDVARIQEAAATLPKALGTTPLGAARFSSSPTTSWTTSPTWSCPARPSSRGHDVAWRRERRPPP